MDKKQSQLEDLYTAIDAIVEMFVGHLETEEIKDQLTKTLYDTVIRVAKKYAIGCIEHGDNPILACPWESSAADELADLIVYLNIPKWKRAIEADRDSQRIAARTEPEQGKCPYCGEPEQGVRTCPCQRDE